MRLVFPWPPSVLRPNASSPGNWRKRSEAAKKYKGDCLIVCQAAHLKPVAGAKYVHLAFSFAPPDRQRRDIDGMLSSVKHLIDAISDRIGIDDSDFNFSISKTDPVKHGAVNVQIFWH